MTEIFFKLHEDEKLIQASNIIFGFIFLVSGSLMPVTSTWFNPLACIIGTLYTVFNTRLLYLIVSYLRVDSGSKTLGILLAAAKFPVLLLFVYLVILQGEAFLFSCLIGLFVFVPSAFVFSIKAKLQKPKSY
ncbi:MAG: hypothetical protein KDD56_07610 [Bdellovibrionales bacterium]|nr:hypothetical protein [Bdellovibrionales bacterium]